jgi:hypothetical protein
MDDILEIFFDFIASLWGVNDEHGQSGKAKLIIGVLLIVILIATGACWLFFC